MPPAINGREKGGRFEREIAKVFSEWTGEVWDRVFRSGGGKAKGDITPVNAGSRFCIELKRRECFSIDLLWQGKGEALEWWIKLKKEAREGKQMPMLIAKRNRSPTVVILDSKGWKHLFVDTPPKKYVHLGALDIFIVDMSEMISLSNGKSILK